MRVLILGVAGTLMAGVAQLALARGFEVTGLDAAFHPPISDLLLKLDLPLHEGYEQHLHLLDHAWDTVVVGNALSRGMPIIERLLDSGLPYTSAPAFLAEHVLGGRKVIAVAGTHGKTTTTSLLAWIFQQSGRDVGYLIGGQPLGFSDSAHLGTDPIFVIEADEYDSAFFDKEAKMQHYHPHDLIMGNVEFDHADIYVDLAAIQANFAKVVRTVPHRGQLFLPLDQPNVQAVLEGGCWTPITYFAPHSDERAACRVCAVAKAPMAILLDAQGQQQRLTWSLNGEHNRANAAAACACALHEGVSFTAVSEALSAFPGVKRRLEYKGAFQSAPVYDDFAHHPTAIRQSIAAIKAREPGRRLLVLLQLGSYTMCSGDHAARLPEALALADVVLLLASRPAEGVVEQLRAAMPDKIHHLAHPDEVNGQLRHHVASGDCLLIMGNQDVSGFVAIDA